MIQSSHLKALGLSLLLLFITACGSDDGSGGGDGNGPSISDIQGSWEATIFAFDIAGTGPSMRVDLIEEGATATMVIQSSGRFTIDVTEPGGAQDLITGQMGFDDDLLEILFDDETESEYFSFSLTNNGNTMFLSGPAEYDLDEDGTDDPAIVEITWVRN